MKILIPLDGFKESEAVIPFVENLVSETLWEKKFEITLLHVIPSFRPFDVPPVYYNERELVGMMTESNSYLKKAGECLESKGALISVKTVVSRDSAEEIVKAAEEINVDLIAMATHGRSGISRWAIGSIADKVQKREKRIPVVTVKATYEWEHNIPLVTVQTPSEQQERIPIHA